MFSQSQPSPIIGTGSIAPKDNFLSALSIKTEKSCSWIINFGASDHTTENATLFHIYNPYSEKYEVRIADGSLSIVVGINSIVISKNLTLRSVLLFLNPTCNFLSINKITRDLNCITMFFPTYCEFQELDSGMTIDNVKECVGLYILRVDDSLEERTQNASCVSTPALVSQFNRDSILVVGSNNDGAIMLWHYRLGHPSFLYSEKLFPSLYNDKNLKFFSVRIVNFPNMFEILIQISHTSVSSHLSHSQ